MRTLLLTLTMWFLTMASGQYAAGAPDKMEPREMAAKPLSDETLDSGTLSVLLRGGRVEGVEVLTVPSTASEDGAPAENEILARGRTNAEGRVFLNLAVHAGRQVRVLVKAHTGPQWSVPFEVPRVGGVRFLFLASDPAPAQETSDAVKRPAPDDIHDHSQRSPPDPHQSMRHTGPTTQDPAGLRLWMAFRIIAIEGGSLYMQITYTLLAGDGVSFHPGEHGLLLPVPQGSKSVSLPHRDPGLKAEKHGILVTRPVPTGRHGLQFTANVALAADRPSVDVRLASLVPIMGYSTSLKAYPRVRIAGPRLDPPETLDAPGEHGGPRRVYRSSKEGFPRTSLSFQVTGIPVRSRTGSWPFAMAALLLLLGGGGLSVAHAWRRKPQAPLPSASPKVEPARKDPVDALVSLEQDRLLGILDTAAFEAARQQVLDSVARGPVQDAAKDDTMDTSPGG